MTPTTPSPISPVKELEALCALIPEDAYWGMPLTPDLVRYIRASVTAPIDSAKVEDTGEPVYQVYDDHDSVMDWVTVSQKHYEGANPKYRRIAPRLPNTTPSTQAVGEPSHHDLNERITALEAAMDGVTQEMLDGGWNARSLSKYAKSLEEKLAAIPVTSALTDERIGELAAQYSSALHGPDSGKWDFAFDNYEPLCEFARAVIKESMCGEPK